MLLQPVRSRLPCRHLHLLCKPLSFLRFSTRSQSMRRLPTRAHLALRSTAVHSCFIVYAHSCSYDTLPFSAYLLISIITTRHIFWTPTHRSHCNYSCISTALLFSILTWVTLGNVLRRRRRHRNVIKCLLFPFEMAFCLERDGLALKEFACICHMNPILWHDNLKNLKAGPDTPCIPL